MTTHPGRATLLRARRPLGLLAAAVPLAGCVIQAGPSPRAAPGYGYACYAGAYACRMPRQSPLGTPCSCPGLGAPSFGTVR